MLLGDSKHHWPRGIWTTAQKTAAAKNTFIFTRKKPQKKIKTGSAFKQALPVAKTAFFDYGCRKRKNWLPEPTGTAFETVPLAPVVPDVFVVHCESGNAIFVVLNTVYPEFGAAVPVRTRLPFEINGRLNPMLPVDVTVSRPVAGSNVPVPAGRMVTELKFPLPPAAELNNWNTLPATSGPVPEFETTSEPL